MALRLAQRRALPGTAIGQARQWMKTKAQVLVFIAQNSK
jgi:hypothetical protein